MWGKKLPKKAGGRYLVTYKGVVRQADYVEYPKGNFGWNILLGGRVSLCEVTAHQKEPRPYNEPAE